MSYALFGGGVAAPLTGFAAPVTTRRREQLREEMRQKARQLAAEPFVAQDKSVPQELAQLDYDAYRRIEFRNDRSLWRDSPSGYEVQPLHRGFIQTAKMKIYLLDEGGVQELAYDPDLFEFNGMTPPSPALHKDLGYSGVRLLGQLDDVKIAREFLVFQGASYFRAISAGTAYGLSARGLAVRTGNPAGEEFPAFTELWIERPASASDDLIMHALLDGPSVTGAFMFTVRTGVDGPAGASRATRMGVNLSLFPRVDLDHIGIAPLTSMYWFGPLERGSVDDYRRRVHDSDGLSICTPDGEWQWRALSNPATLQVSSFGEGNAALIKGFGLIQRERNWKGYRDMGADYHRRPSCWVIPHKEWPEGRVDLIEIPTDSEYHDNVVAYWRPRDVLPAGSESTFGYDLVWSAEPSTGLGLLQVAASASGAVRQGLRQIVIDFTWPEANEDGINVEITDAIGTLVAKVDAPNARVEAIALAANPEMAGIRLSFLIEPTTQECEVSAVISQYNRQVSETWIYRFQG